MARDHGSHAGGDERASGGGPDRWRPATSWREVRGDPPQSSPELAGWVAAARAVARVGFGIAEPVDVVQLPRRPDPQAVAGVVVLGSDRVVAYLAAGLDRAVGVVLAVVARRTQTAPGAGPPIDLVVDATRVGVAEWPALVAAVRALQPAVGLWVVEPDPDLRLRALEDLEAERRVVSLEQADLGQADLGQRQPERREWAGWTTPHGGRGGPGPTGPADPADVAEVARALAAAGATPEIEGGVLIGTVLGLEVARARPGPSGLRLEVGVGEVDRAAAAAIAAEEAVSTRLAAVVADVRRRRRADAPAHPARDLAPERWLRVALGARPEWVGARELRPVASPFLPARLGRPSPAAAVGCRADGRPVVVVCSVGVDLGLAPLAGAVRDAVDPDAELICAVPSGDDLPITAELLRVLRVPGRLRGVPRTWREATTERR